MISGCNLGLKTLSKYTIQPRLLLELFSKIVCRIAGEEHVCRTMSTSSNFLEKFIFPCVKLISTFSLVLAGSIKVRSHNLISDPFLCQHKMAFRQRILTKALLAEVQDSWKSENEKNKA